MDELIEPGTLKQYLLGSLGDESARERIEERIMTDEDLAEQVGVAEDELIEEFLDGELTDDESARFTRFFLAPPERRRHFRLTRDLRRISASGEKRLSHRGALPAGGPTTTGWLRFVAVGALLAVVGAVAWVFLSGRSDTDRGWQQLRAAYRDRRPTESRLAEFEGYAPYTVTRGGTGAASDSAALDRAQRYLTDATADSSDPEAHHALAVFYLAAGDLERSEREMAAALGSGSSTAKIESDAGAIYLEAARRSADSGDGAAALTALDTAKRHLDRALAQNSRLPEARFNMALCLQAMMVPEQAKAAWRAYLDIDPDSKWAEEARQNLQRLEDATPRESSAEEVESDFLAALRNGDEEAAARLIANNRELVRDKYVPHRLAMSIVNAPDDRRDELLAALRFAGKIEFEKTGDPFSNEIAHFYASLPDEKFEGLKAAHGAIRDGAALVLKPDYTAALPHFEAAARMFSAAGDDAEAQLANYFAGYVYFNLDDISRSAAELEKTRTWAVEHRAAWLEGAALHWIAACRRRQKDVSAAEGDFAAALAIAEKMHDPYAVQRNRLALSELHSSMGQTGPALNDLFQVLQASAVKETSLRQLYRNLFQAVKTLADAGSGVAARQFANESIALADRHGNPVWVVQSRGFAGVAAAREGDVDEARRLLEEAEAKAASIPDPAARAMPVAFADLQFAELERSIGNYEAAERRYLAASRFYDADGRSSLLREQTRNGLLQTYLALGRSDELEQRIPTDVRLTEEYRGRVGDEARTIGFFAIKANIYDIASEFELGRGNAEAAYNYAETSSSRSLLDRMAGAKKDAGQQAPLDLAAIRRDLPEGVQIVQYSVFQRKVVIWVFDRERFEPVTVDVDANDLAAFVSEFTRLVSRPTGDPAVSDAAARRLYDLLISPIRGRLDPNREICIIPSKFLFDVPFAALIAPDSKPLVAAFRLLNAPSANVLVAASRNAATRGGSGRESILAVGDPAFDRERFGTLPTLPAAEREAVEVAQLYARPSRTLLGGGATRAAFLAALPAAEVVHFAGHYVAMPGMPAESFLLLAKDGDAADGKLTNAQMSEAALPRTRLIVLAACRSGVEGYADAEGMVGMSRTMLAAKVPLVVASRWDVDSAATTELMHRFHELRVRNNMPTTAAMRAAQLEMAGDPRGRFRSPYYWAAFAVFGGHASF
jgi:CHAT domain-containing protein